MERANGIRFSLVSAWGDISCLITSALPSHCQNISFFHMSPHLRLGGFGKGLIPQFLPTSLLHPSLPPSGSLFIVKVNFTHRMLLRRGDYVQSRKETDDRQWRQGGREGKVEELNSPPRSITLSLRLLIKTPAWPLIIKGNEREAPDRWCVPERVGKA